MVEETLIQSAQIYFEYLEERGLGVEEIKILSHAYSNNELTLALQQKIFSLDNLVFCVGGEEYPIGEEEQVSILSYDEKALVLKLCFSNPAILDIENFRLVSDLKFLIKNVENFFSEHKIALPSKTPLELKEENILINELSLEQQKALRTIFSHPLVYIWGAPGSGKTQRVLFQAILHLLKQGKKIALVAPTNNALEQALKTLIAKLDELNLDRTLILRLGVPTLEFSQVYPEICESVKNRESNLFNFSNPKERIKEAQVLAMTLDGFIKRYKDLGVRFDHCFLDECAFAPLIKVCALCAMDIPLTLLGDHQQLMPVCEMKEKDIHAQPQAKLWNVSALFLEHFLQDKELVGRLDFAYTKTAVLKQTHRYGDNLASILNAYIYKNGLKGRSEDSEIYYLDCSKLDISSLRGESKGNSNLYEIAGVKQLTKELEDWGVITPFVQQRKDMIFNGIPYDKVFTIHGSQGQEFENVIFSPVSLHFHLTDSNNPNALKALNVAISRVKKRLFIVCDYGYWMREGNQFLSAILREAKEWRNH